MADSTGRTSSQYDAIGTRYNYFKTLPTAILETHNLERALRPHCPGARVLDLACGLGYYSHKCLSWGALSVLGIDLSSEMVSAASASITHPEQEDTLRFRQGDAAKLGKVEGEEPFDVVLGCWLLNYASSEDVMTDMFATAAANLKPRGVFVGVTPHAVEDVDEFAAHTNAFEEENPGKWGASVRYYERLASGEGWRTEITGAGVQFRNYHLAKGVYERAARRGGMEGRLEWRAVELPPEREALERKDKEWWEEYFAYGPHMGVLVVEK